MIGPNDDRPNNINIPRLIANEMALARSQLVNVWSLAGLALATCIYLVFEVAYNASVVRVLSSASAEKATIEGMETIGKLMASIGVTLVASRLIGLRRALSFVGIVAVLYFTLGFAVRHYLDGLSAPARVSGHWLGMYRLAVLRGDIDAPDMLTDPSEPPTTSQRLALANVALLGYGYEDAATAAAKRYLDTAVKAAAGGAISPRQFESLWRGYTRASAKLLPYYEREKRYASHVITPTDFMNEAKTSFFIGREVRAYCDAVIYPGNTDLGLDPVKACDLPQFLTKAQLRAEVDRRIAADARQVRAHFSPSTVGPMSEVTHDLSSTVFIPPISMSLSLLSVFLNVASLAGILAVLIVAKVRIWFFANTARMLQGTVTVIVLVGLLAWSGAGSPFPDGSRFRAGEDAARHDGAAAAVWAFALDRETTLLNLVERVDPLIALADRLPRWGHAGSPGKKSPDNH
ncbi:Uncharacterised protein [Burkholderia pseudomallei]|nr:Uncharacterised protein [Burkholderia pseudomallei]